MGEGGRLGEKVRGSEVQMGRYRIVTGYKAQHRKYNQ